MIPKPINEIGRADLMSLIENAVPESRTLDYKEALSMGSDEEKKELLSDVASFANTSGGDMVFGMVEERDATNKQTGLPSRAVGLTVSSMDATTLSLLNLIRDGIAPQIIGIQVQPVEGKDGKRLIVLRIPSSYNAPHMVTLKMRPAFYGRTAGGRFPMDVSAIRTAFTLSASLGERVQRFRDERLIRVSAGETPLPVGGHGTLVIHLFPASAASPASQLDIRTVADGRQPLKPLWSIRWTPRYNVDGYAAISRYDIDYGRGTISTYQQVFRNGAIEFAASGGNIQPGEPNMFYGTQSVRKILESVKAALRLYEGVGIAPPIFCMVSILDVKDFYMSQDSPDGSQYGGGIIERENLLLPDVMIPDYRTDVAGILRPVFDTLWQSAGWEECPHYDSAGKWKFPE